MSTHVDSDLLCAYTTGEIDAAHAFSVDAHVVLCPTCQAAVAPLADPVRLERVLAAVEDELDAPPLGAIERVLRALRIRPDLGRLLAATPSLSLSWLSSVALALSFAVMAAREGEHGMLLFLCLAALLPMAGVAMSFSRALDPTFEIGVAAPFSSVRLLLLRAATVLATTAAIAGAAATALPGAGWNAVAWVVPSLALTLASLALATYIPALAAFAVVTTAWLAVVLLNDAVADDVLAMFGRPAQVGLVALGAGAALVLGRRVEHLDVQRSI
ncbi:MAG TPA: hypothetical protein VGO80_14370 [Solirubrobacteraceae bacterium]|jgi:hypothetical protein|nr:hypothetical protein [Solirubrobacteraceae bacterium]